MTYPFKAFIETLFSYDQAAQDTYLKTRLWYPDKPNSATTFKKANDSGYNKRQEVIKEGNIVQFSTIIHHDLFNLRKYL